MKQRRSLVAAGLATVLFTTVAACGGDSDESSEATAGEETASAPEATEPAPEATDAPATTAPAADGPDTAKGDIPEGGVEVTIEGDVTTLADVTAGIANLAPVPGAERWSRPSRRA